MTGADNRRGDLDESQAARARGGAAVGAGFGGLLGAVIGWLMAAIVPAGPITAPTIGPVVGQWVLPSSIVGLLAGVAFGALVGALAAVTTSRAAVTEQSSFGTTGQAGVDEALPDQDSLPLASGVAGVDAESMPASAETTADEPATVAPPARRRKRSARAGPALESPPEANAESEKASTAGTVAEPPQEVALVETPRRRAGRPRRSVGNVSDGGEASTEAAGPKRPADEMLEPEVEGTNVSDEQKGRDPNTFTGTTDAIDPETGAVGTAGTPVTTGYGVSGSTVGTGSRRRQRKQEKGDFRGATPDSASYDIGGRGTGDAGVLEGAEQEAPVVDRNSDAERVEASVPRDREGRDVYEQSEGYAESLERESDQPVVRRRSSGAQESAGTNIPGTADARGLGDNTDE